MRTPADAVNSDKLFLIEPIFTNLNINDKDEM